MGLCGWAAAVMAAFAISGCRGGKPIEPDGGPGGGGGPTVLVSDDGSFHAPPHVFNPRPHQPRIHNDPPPPNLASLPKMVERHRQCFGQPVEKDRSSGSIGLGNSGAIGKGGGGSRGSAFGSGGGRAPSKPSPKAKKVARSTRCRTSRAAPATGSPRGLPRRLLPRRP